MISWSQLPIDVQLDIFDILAQGPEDSVSRTRTPDRTKTPNRKAGLAQYAAVCKQWHSFFEKKLFRRLTLTQWCLDNFEKSVVRQRGLVQHIWLRIELARYGCFSYKEPRLVPPGKSDVGTVRDAITGLFSILSSWEIDRDRSLRGLTLEISAYSPSDLEHDLQGDVYLDTDFVPIEDLETNGPHDVAHGWSNGQRLGFPAEMAKVFTYLCPELQTLPIVEVVTRLLIRRLSRRDFLAGGSDRLVQSLPNLDSITLEPWREFMRPYGYPGDIDRRKLLSTCLPETLRSLTLFEDFNETFNMAYATNWAATRRQWRPELIRTPCPDIGSALAQTSVSLERVSASYLVDAVDFFKACEADWIWNKLTLLALTSQLFRERSNSEEINTLLVNAGTVALQMPKLQRLEIWHGLKRNAVVFRYQVTNTSTTISWCGTWKLGLDLNVLRVWREVAGMNTRHELSVGENKWVDEEVITSHAAAIRQLELSDQVIHPVSLEEISRESKRYEPSPKWIHHNQCIPS